MNVTTLNYVRKQQERSTVEPSCRDDVTFGNRPRRDQVESSLFHTFELDVMGQLYESRVLRLEGK